jgi:hypothetical protein
MFRARRSVECRYARGNAVDAKFPRDPTSLLENRLLQGEMAADIAFSRDRFREELNLPLVPRSLWIFEKYGTAVQFSG